MHQVYGTKFVGASSALYSLLLVTFSNNAACTEPYVNLSTELASIVFDFVLASFMYDFFCWHQFCMTFCWHQLRMILC